MATPADTSQPERVINVNARLQKSHVSDLEFIRRYLVQRVGGAVTMTRTDAVLAAIRIARTHLEQCTEQRTIPDETNR